MATTMGLNHTDHTHEVLECLRSRGWNHNTCGALVGLLGGIVAPLSGSLLTAFAWIVGPTWHGFALRTIGAVLLFLTIPLLLFGAHCLDLSDKAAGKRGSRNEVRLRK